MKNSFVPFLAVAAVAILFQSDALAQSGSRGAAVGGSYSAPAAPVPMQSQVMPMQDKAMMGQPMMQTAMPAGTDIMEPMAGDHMMHDHGMHDDSMAPVMHDHAVTAAPTCCEHAPAVHVQHCTTHTATPKTRRTFLSWLFRR